MVVLEIVVVVMTLVTVTVVGTDIVAAMLSVGVLVLEFVFAHRVESDVPIMREHRESTLTRGHPPDYTRIKILRRASALAYRADQCIENALLGKSPEE